LGIPILESVLRCLEEEGFPASEAYPGQPFPQITGPVAAFHIHKVDSGSRTATVEVTIHCPASLGGAACEEAALGATAALQTSGALCVQNGCIYDGLNQIYSVSILATFTAVAENNDCTTGVGFQIHLDGVYHPWAVAFTEEKVQEQTIEFATRSPVAVAITPGSYYWNIRLEELIPSGSQETAEPEGEFQLRVVRGTKAELYGPCRWSSITRSFTAKGLRRVCKGIALMREEDKA